MDTLISDASARTAAEHWLRDFAMALTSANEAAVAALFADECYWRDILAFGWDLRTTAGAPAIAERLISALTFAAPRDWQLAKGRTPPRVVVRAGTTCVEAILQFETAVGPCNGVVRLVTDGATFRAWSLMTTLDEIRGHEDPANGKRWQNVDWKRNFGGENWADRRRKAVACADRDPAVLVVGAAQAGLTVAARLSLLGLDTLLIDREKRLGDSWRRRYHALTLHNETRVNHFPYMPFPRSWPVFIPKDMLANWFEFYSEAMELNVWTSTELVTADYDDTRKEWTATLRQGDGSNRVMHPRHIVFCNGVSTIPKRPDLPGLEDFKGVVRHSGEYGSGLQWTGKRALVLGTGTSGHDVAQDLATSGAHVSIIQHGPTLVVSLKEAQSPYALYDEDIPFEDLDLLAIASPYPVYRRAHQQITRKNAEADRELLEGLKSRGFKLTSGPDGTGWQIMYQNRGAVTTSTPAARR